MEIITQSETENIPQDKQIYDADNGKWIDNPLLKKEESETKEEEEKTKEKEVKKPADKVEEKEEEETEEETSTEEEEQEEEEETEESDKDKKSKEEEEQSLSSDEYITSVFGEKFGVKNEADLSKIVENAIDVMDELEDIKKENATLKSEAGKPKFKSDKERAAFEFISQYDIDRQGEALDTYAKLLGMDVDSSDPKLLLEEQFVHKHPEWTRAEAQRMFKKQYDRKYNLKREAFEGSDAEYEQELADLKIEEKGEVANAKNYLKEQKGKYKPAEKEVAPKVNEAVSKAVEKNVKDYGDFVSKTKEWSFEDDGEKYIYKLDAEKQKLVAQAVNDWVKNPALYDAKGKLAGASTPDEMFEIVVGSMFMKEIVSSLKSQIKNKVNEKRVDEIGKIIPKKRTVPGSGEAKTNKDDLDDQARALIKNRKAA